MKVVCLFVCVCAAVKTLLVAFSINGENRVRSLSNGGGKPRVVSLGRQQQMHFPAHFLEC